MTREDIDDIINAICPNDEDYEKPCISPKYLRQELEQLALDQRQWNEESTTKNNLGVDCISRTRAIERLQLNFPVSAGADNSKERYRYMQALADLQAIKELPSVTPIRPKGRWIFIGEENEEETRNGNFRYICSECAYSDVHAKSTEVPYCWHCGAKMVEPQESEG